LKVAAVDAVEWQTGPRSRTCHTSCLTRGTSRSSRAAERAAACIAQPLLLQAHVVAECKTVPSANPSVTLRTDRRRPSLNIMCRRMPLRIQRLAR